MIFPVDYNSLDMQARRAIRLQYVAHQDGKCHFCQISLDKPPATEVTNKLINWDLFPGGKNFLNYPIHLDHDHYTGMTQGAVHAYCNAVLFQYYGH
jgi:hypothetical protein